MKIIADLSDKIMDEIACAEKYAKEALFYKEDYPNLAAVFYRIGNDKLTHMNLLHGQVVSIIDEYRKEHGEPPEHMKILYDILHKKQIEQVAAVKGILSLYNA